jgi:Domain of unknown function (DUF6398)
VAEPRVPTRLRAEVEAISALTYACCAARLDAEYAELCRRLTAKLARKRPSPLLRGDLRIWAAGILYAVGSVNFLFDRSQPLHLSADDLSALIGVPKSTMANKSKRIRDLLGLRPLDHELCRRDLLEGSSLAWLIVVNGIVVDARWLPPELQAEASRRGLIPDLEPSIAAA